MNRTFLFLLTFLFTFINATAQRVMLDEIHCTPPEEYTDEKVFEVFEQRASFYGGEEVLMRWLMQHISYPEECGKTGVEGRVIASFVVDRDGLITDVKVLRSPDERLSNEAVRLVKSMPRWQPAMQGNKFVRSRFNLPIMFRIKANHQSEVAKRNAGMKESKKDEVGGIVEIVELTQIECTYPPKHPKTKTDAKPKNKVIEQKAELAYMQKSNLYYPRECAEQGIQGRVLINFSIGKDGKPSDIKVIESPHPELSKEATTFVKSSILFTPKARITIGPKPSAKYYKTDFCLPIVFKLNKN